MENCEGNLSKNNLEKTKAMMINIEFGNDIKRR